MFFAMTFVSLRILQILTLIPIMGMLAWFVDGYNSKNILTPESILVLFIVSVLAVAWVIFTLFSYHRSSANAIFVGLVDLGFFAALIVGVWYLRNISRFDCTKVYRDSDWSASLGAVTLTGPGYNWRTDKPCAMLKASWVLAIINVVLFFITAIVAFMHGDRLSATDRRRRSHHGSRHTHRSNRSRSRSGSRYSRHSSHSRRVYV